MRNLADRRVLVGGLFALSIACTTSVEPAPVALHLRVRGADGPVVVNVQTQLPLEAIPVTADSTRLPEPISAAWTSADTSKATVDEDGVLHARCVGPVIITATASIDGRTLSGHLPVDIGSTGSACAP